MTVGGAVGPAGRRCPQPAASSSEGLEERELLRAMLSEKDVRPIEAVDDLACDGIFETDDELSEFLNWVSAERRANLA